MWISEAFFLFFHFFIKKFVVGVVCRGVEIDHRSQQLNFLCSFGTLWIMDFTSGIIREVVKG